MNNEYFIADSTQIEIRKVLAEEFYNSILDSEEIPFVVTDSASLYDIYIGDKVELMKKVKEKYGIDLDLQYFKLPFWKLLDYLEENRVK